MCQRRMEIFLVPLYLLWVLLIPTSVIAQADLYIKDTPADLGVEPNSDTGAMWVSEDIWVRRSPDPGYQATPFPEVSPSWTPLPHQDPEYRDPIFSVPNYVYVRVRNRGTAASSGTERLKLYWAKASTGLAWDSQWVDYLDSTCGPTQLYGAEVTKPRKNAATATAAERNAYRDAILDIGTLPAFVFPGSVSYWHKQDEVHENGPSNRHLTPAFLPWHREFINRYEVLLQKADPTVKLLYWDWTTDPENSTGGFNFFTSSFMGASGFGSGVPVSIGAPFDPALAPPAVARKLRAIAPPAGPDAGLLANASYPLFWSDNEFSHHNGSHTYIGGNVLPVGNMSMVADAAEDPFFFLLHGNVDRLWAQWQRDPSALSRLESATAYDGHSSNINITTVMGPWDGTGSIQPWTTGGGQIVSKTPKNPSVVSPPIYDTAPLVVPVLAPGEAVILQIPWYPPDPADFSCFGPTDFDHFCLLARVETSTSAPFGMTFPEGTSVYTNTRNNNNIAWKNLSVVDNFAGPLGLIGLFIRNVHAEPATTGLVFTEVEGDALPFLDVGRIIVELGPELFERWMAGGALGENVRTVQGEYFAVELLAAEAALRNITLEGAATYPVAVRFELAEKYLSPGPRPLWDIVQVGSPDDPEEIIGGNRYQLDFQKLRLIPRGSQWRFRDRGEDPGADWTSVEFDDTDWRTARGSLGFGDAPDTTLDGGPVAARHSATYFRHTFEVQNPAFYDDLLLRLRRDDGAVVYLNGSEIYRVHMPDGPPTYGTLATRDVDGLEEEQYFSISVTKHLSLLNAGENVVAVEIHQASPGSDDLSFDLELCANNLVSRFPPDLRFDPSVPSLVQVGEEISITIEAADPDPKGTIASVQLLADGELVGMSDAAPHTFPWSAQPLGIRRLQATAIDGDGETASVDVTLSVVSNAPPVATLLAPSDHESFQAGEPIQLMAEASDVAVGEVTALEFYVVNMRDIFTTTPTRVGEVTQPPYAMVTELADAGHYMIYAVAIDDQGLSSQSNPAHIRVEATSSSSIFADGFESGDTSAWSSTAP